MPKRGKKKKTQKLVEYFCNYCGVKCFTIDGVASHQTTVHSKSTFKCNRNRCTCCFETDAQLNMHKDSHLGKRKCTVCRRVVEVEVAAEDEEVVAAAAEDAHE